MIKQLTLELNEMSNGNSNEEYDTNENKIIE